MFYNMSTLPPQEAVQKVTNQYRNKVDVSEEVTKPSVSVPQSQTAPVLPEHMAQAERLQAQVSTGTVG